jgi:ribosomal protein L37AE/L43A
MQEDIQCPKCADGVLKVIGRADDKRFLIWSCDACGTNFSLKEAGRQVLKQEAERGNKPIKPPK